MILTDAGIDAMLDVRESVRFWLRYLIGDEQAGDSSAPLSTWDPWPRTGWPPAHRGEREAEKEQIDGEFHV